MFTSIIDLAKKMTALGVVAMQIAESSVMAYSTANPDGTGTVNEMNRDSTDKIYKRLNDLLIENSTVAVVLAVAAILAAYKIFKKSQRSLELSGEAMRAMGEFFQSITDKITNNHNEQDAENGSIQDQEANSNDPEEKILNLLILSEAQKEQTQASIKEIEKTVESNGQLLPSLAKGIMRKIVPTVISDLFANNHGNANATTSQTTSIEENQYSNQNSQDDINNLSDKEESKLPQFDAQHNTGYVDTKDTNPLLESLDDTTTKSTPPATMGEFFKISPPPNVITTKFTKYIKIY